MGRAINVLMILVSADDWQQSNLSYLPTQAKMSIVVVIECASAGKTNDSIYMLCLCSHLNEPTPVAVTTG